jgi:hypothetical protein
MLLWFFSCPNPWVFKNNDASPTSVRWEQDLSDIFQGDLNSVSNLASWKSNLNRWRPAHGELHHSHIFSLDPTGWLAISMVLAVLGGFCDILWHGVGMTELYWTWGSDHGLHSQQRQHWQHGRGQRGPGCMLHELRAKPWESWNNPSLHSHVWLLKIIFYSIFSLCMLVP